jgi:hypothetical protein
MLQFLPSSLFAFKAAYRRKDCSTPMSLLGLSSRLIRSDETNKVFDGQLHEIYMTKAEAFS